MQDDEYWLGLALSLAQQAETQGEVPVGAVVVLDNELIGAGFNQPISMHDPTAHAEVLALREAAKKIGNYRLPQATLYVTLEPCLMCASAMVHARIKRLVYGATEPKAGAIISQLQVLDLPFLNHKIHHQGGVLKKACGTLLSDFFAKRR